MVEQGKRPRGRPVGSCLDDAATLARIAELLVSGAVVQLPWRSG